MTMKNLSLPICGVLLLAQLSPLVPQARAMSMPAHLDGTADLGGMNDLLGTPVEQGGAGNMPPAKVQSIGDWMDNPAQKTGQYNNHAAGGKPVHPSNHNLLRHNPDNVGRVFSGDGTVDPAARNVARVHKIQDIYNNSRPVDGWEITPGTRTEAEQLLRSLKESKRLPARLPTWVDQPGPLIKTRLAPLPPSGASKALVFSRGLGAITTAAAVAATVHSIEQTEQRYERRELTATQRGEQHGQAVGEFVLGCGGAIAGSFLGIPGGLPGMIGGGLAGGAAGSMAGAELGRTTLGRSLGGMYEAEEKQVSAAAGNFLRAAGPLTLNPEAYSGIGIGPATERALAGER